MKKTIFLISKMDCPSEERLIRMKLDDLGAIKHLDFNIPARRLTVTHENDASEILDRLIPLNFGASLVETSAASSVEDLEQLDPAKEASVLKVLLAINGGMFVVELLIGLYAHSLGLISDALDMFADATVYGLSLYAVGKAISAKKRAAKISGYFQMVLATGAVIEAMRRFFYGSDAEGSFMIGISVIALIANVSCLLLLSKHKEGEVHMRASWIFSANDVIANLGVIVAGILVMATGSSLPDLIIGIAVAGFVFKGALSILRL